MTTSLQAGAETASRAFCAAVSSAQDESLAATASRIDHWVLVEYRGRWGRDVLGGSLLSSELKAHLREQLAALGHSRLLFVKRPERRSQGGRRVFFGTSRPGAERLFRLEVEHQEDLRGIDLVAALHGDGAPGDPVDGPLLVVCTHGKRDPCCSLHGRPLYDALRREQGSASVWQSTHVGGDRFAGNVVVLPHGLYYGRVGPADARGLLAAHAAGKVDLERYRGRSAFSFPVQAAEQAIRESEGLLGIDELEYLGTTRLGDDSWRVRFRAPDRAVHEVDVTATFADEPAYLTCGSAERQLARRHMATAHRVLSG
ncbi:MAG TPA: sucrase ferredoxin [Gaiella sp.]|nr:sucrase ferredoxin [Gaiella sp.]